MPAPFPTMQLNARVKHPTKTKKEKREAKIAAKRMENSFIERRELILLEKPKIKFIKQKYPHLFTLPEICNELDRIVATGASKQVLANIEMYAEFILNIAEDIDPLLILTHQKKKEFTSSIQQKYAVEVGSILLLTSLINEERNFLKLDDSAFKVSTFPYIEAEATLEEIFSDQCNFKVYAEKILICEVTNFKEAILCLIACYFIFSIQYPPKNFNTLATIEKLYLEGNDTDVNDIDKFSRQIIKSLQLKAAARRK